jgi:hypothetical protein
MSNIFLSPDLKKYYMDDFTKNVLTCTDEFWGISNDIKDILIKVNENQKVQSIYSHKQTFNDWGMKPSYIDIAFTQDIELTIFRDIIPYFQACYNTDDHNKFNYYYSYPKSDEDVKEKNGTNDLASRTDKDYWKINNIRFELTTNSKDVDDKFWQDIQAKFAGLK